MKKKTIIWSTLLVIIATAGFIYYKSGENLRFKNAFTSKQWYYSTDGGKSWNGRAEDGLKEFDIEGNPVHKDPVWGTGKWKNSNTILWKAINDSEAIWKAFETPPY